MPPRHIAKNLVAAGVANEVLVELSYAIGIAQPLSIYVDTYRSPRPAALEGMTTAKSPAASAGFSTCAPPRS